MRWRRKSALDFYTAAFGLFLFVSPWLFAYANKNARLDLWASGAAIAAISIAAIIAFSNWEEWLNLLLGLWLISLAMGAGVCPYQGDACQHRARRDGCVHRRAGTVARQF